MNAVDRERERRDDHCPVCGEGIDWSDGWHRLWQHGERVLCWSTRDSFDVAVLDLAHLND
jgi:hypothetical protein